MKSVIINLERQPERKKHARSECQRVGIVPSVLNATDANYLSQEWIAKNVSSELQSFLFDPHYHSMNLGALACSDSHRRAWAFLSTEVNNCPALVLEDDFFWLHSSSFIDEKLHSIAKSDFDIVLLGYSPRKPFTPDYNNCYVLGNGVYILPYENVGRTSGAYAYMISKKAADHLLVSQSGGIDREADDFAKEFYRLGQGLRMGIVYPPIVHHGLFKSAIWTDSSRSKLKIIFSWLAVHSVFFRRIYAWALAQRLARRYVVI